MKYGTMILFATLWVVSACEANYGTAAPVDEVSVSDIGEM